MKWFSNLKITTRLLLAFVIMIAAAMAIGAIGLTGLINVGDKMTQITTVNLPKLNMMIQIDLAMNEARMGERTLSKARIDDNTRNESQDTISGAFVTIETVSSEYVQKSRDKEEQAFWDQCKPLLDQWQKNISDYLLLANDAAKIDSKTQAELRTKKFTELDTITMGVNNQSFKAAAAKLADLTSYIRAEADNKQANASMTMNSSLQGIVIIIALGFLLMVLLYFLIRGSIKRPLKKVMEGVAKLSNGDINAVIALDTRDELGTLARAFDKLANTIKSLISDMQYMAKEHDRGDVDVIIPGENYQMAFNDVATGINSMVAGHIAVNRKAMECVSAFGQGNFNAPLERFPGKKAFINEVIEQVRGNLKAVMADIGMLTEAAVQGQLAARADASRHHGDFGKIVQGINSMLSAVIEPVNEAAYVLGEMSNGNFSSSVKGDYQGDHAAMKLAINQTNESMKGYIREVAYILTEMANGNLDVGITGQYRGECLAIKESLNVIIESFNSMLSEMGVAADQVSSGTQHVADGAQALAQGATEQASAVEQLTASLVEIAGRTKVNASNASQASLLVIGARNDAKDGNSRVSELQKSMMEINDASDSISKIIKVIDEIAFQTNLLALNAAVEAARAGQYGKGFAVVAEEVRSLALRSASAAKESNEMIQGSIAKIRAGTKLADESAQALVKIVVGVEKTTELVGGIAAASNSQATAVAQINIGIEQVSHVTQTNSATAEQSAAACEELSGQAALLKDMVERFNLKGQPHSARQASKPQQARNAARPPERRQAAQKPQIALNDREFGKY